MGRNVKPGISFYRIDSGHILNKKVRLLCNEFDSDGYYIWSCVLDYAYNKWGYYFDTNDNDELDLFASEYCKKKLSLVKEVISGCIRRGLFDKAVADLFGILTSEMMQEVFIYATAERRRQGSIFEMREDWLKIDFGDKIPVNLKIDHVNKQQNHCEETTDKTIQNKTETRQEIVAPKAPTHAGKSKKFIPPNADEVEKYFLSTVGNAKKPGYWPADKCKNEAAAFLNYYTANGWVQGKGKKIVDWKASCRSWITNELKGIFSKERPPASVDKPPLTKIPNVSEKLRLELDYLFDRFEEDEQNVTAISISSVHYDYLKTMGLIKLNEAEKEHIRKLAMKGDGADITDMMKRLAVLEYFKKLKSKTLAVVE